MRMVKFQKKDIYLIGVIQHMDPVVIMDLLSGSFGVITSVILFQRYFKYRNIPALMLALCVFIYGLGNFCWFGEDAIAGQQQILVILAYISNYLPAYFGFLFVVHTMNLRKREMTVISTAIAAIGVVGFAIFPLESSIIGSSSVYYLGTELKLILIPLVLMALFMPAFLLAYGFTMREAKNRRETKKGFLLSIGFLLMVLGEFILVPYLKVSLLADQILLLAGFAFISFVFIYTERAVLR
jgi:hypothetical protein